jgi:uncharacterized protein (TIGR02231 family)
VSAVLVLVLASIGAPSSVVVYPDRAQVTRLAPVSCGNRVPLTFTEVPPAAAADSFRARMSEGTVDGLRAYLETKEKEYGPKAKALVAQVEELDRQRKALDDELERARRQADLSRTYGDIASKVVSREMSLDKPDTKAWSAAFDLSLTTAFGAAKAVAETESKLRELNRKQAQLNLQLDGVRAAMARQSYTVEVLVSCPEGKSAELALTYLVGGASWTPAYEARAEEGQGLVELATWATVTQGTGEDWKDVELVLSTAVPTQNATPPELKKLMVTTYERQPEKKVLVRRDEYVDSAKTGDSSATTPAGPQQLQARNQGLSVQLVVPERALVPGDSAPVRLLVGRAKLKAAFELRVMPKLQPVAFRVAELTNTGAWPLLPGRVDAFRTTGLVGRYALERVPMGGPFTLTFGLEDSVRVKRTVVEELKRDTGFLGSTKRFTYAYRFELANYGKAPVDLVVADHIPVSELDDISVQVSEKTTPGFQVGKTDGIVKWKVPVRAQEKKNVDLSFRVEVPSSYETGGL